ncbi:hypothetical protein [Sphaerimonospora mesophila]|uniref:hypothetical protein n=1 Tax=Sphaerimonospora mesophila TaxID=37483 RepID=UPI0006E2CC70
MATPEDRRPYRGQHEPGEERTVTHVHSNGETYRMVLRQVGWHGQSGAFYALGESPHLYETGSYQALWIIAHADQLDEEGNPT